MICRLIVYHCLLVWDFGVRRGNMEQIFDQFWCPLASIEALGTTQWSMRSVLYRRIAMAIKITSK